MKTLRVALVVPNFNWTDVDERFLWQFVPYNLCLLAAMVRDLCEISIIDAYKARTEPEAFVEQIRRCDPDIVGITVLMDQCAPAGHMAARLVKSLNPKIKVVMGGVYATINPEIASQDANVDYLVVGEGEYVLRELLLHLSGKGPLPAEGLWHRAEGKVVSAPRAPFIEDLDALPLPAYDMIDYAAYTRHVHRKSVDTPSLIPYARIVTSRGCPCHCVFCQVETVAGSKFRPRSAETVLQEIAWLKETYGVRSLVFDDDNLYTNRKRLVAILQGMIDRGLVMPWKSIATAVFRLDEEVIAMMRAAGCDYIDVAIESGSQRVLKEIIGKPVNLDHAKRMVAAAKRQGIFVAANFIVGFPTETWDEIRASLRGAEEMDVDYAKIFTAIPMPKTRLWQLCVDTGAFKRGFDPAAINWNVGQIETKDFSCGDLTILRAYEWDRINFTDPQKRKRIAEMMQIDEEELLQIRRDTLAKALQQI